MKKLHILLMGATMILASPAMAEDANQMRSNNDNTRPAAMATQASDVNYADYTANDDDHGAGDDNANEHEDNDDMSAAATSADASADDNNDSDSSAH